MSRRELSHTLCEHFSWVTPASKNRVQACLNALEEMASIDLIQLPEEVVSNARGKKKPIIWTNQTEPQTEIIGSLESLTPLQLLIVDRHNYLGYSHPIGSHLRYFIVDAKGRKLGCILFSFASCILPDRDQWIGWDDKARKKRLEKVINNNRYLIFPWVKVANLTSKVLAMLCLQLPGDWYDAHGYHPLLLETFVDRSQYKGTCYRAANWINVGQTQGTHIDKNGNKKSIKDIYLYPLSKHCQQILTTGYTPPKQSRGMATTTEVAESTDAFVLVGEKSFQH